MGTTLDALNAGSLSYRYVVAIEGYSHLLTNAGFEPGDPFDSWVSTAWSLTSPVGGLFVELDNQGSADPWDPFQSGGTCTLRVVPDSVDEFGIATHRKLSGAETYLTATADRNDTTINVKSTTGFASAGEAFIGTECFGYTGLTSTSFTGVSRGLYSPFATSTGVPWAEYHRVGAEANRVNLSPIVSQQARTWIGKWVAVYLHRVVMPATAVVTEVLDTVDQAQLVFAGKITELRDDSTGVVVVQLKHVLDTVKESTVGRDQYTAEVADGLFMSAGTFLRMFDWSSHPTLSRGATNLAVVASGATGTAQINEGYYTLAQLADLLSAWLAGESAAGHLYGTYAVSSPVDSPDGLRTKIYYRIFNAGSTAVTFSLQMPAVLAMFLGFADYQADLVAQSGNVTVAPKTPVESNADRLLQGVAVPLRAIIGHRESNIAGLALEIGLQNETGVFIDQFAVLPPGSAPTDDAGLEWGVFSFNDAGYIVAAKDGTNLRFVRKVFGFIPGQPTDQNPVAEDALSVGIDQTAPIVIKQIIASSTTFGAYLKSVFYGSGTPGYNHATFDDLPYGFGVNIPGSLLGPGFDASIDALPGAGAGVFIFVEKSMKLSDVLASDLILRWAFPRWRQGTLSFSAWQVPTPDNAIAALTENTKARPSDTSTNDRAVTVLSEEWQHDTITILYNRETVTTENYLARITFEDATAVDDAGGEGKALTLKARNTYSELVESGTGIESIAPDFLTLAPLFTRPFRKIALSIAPALFERLAPGDVVTVADSFARDPTTGRRGITQRAGLILRARYNRGGAQLGNPKGIAAQGEVDVMLAPDQSRIAAYAPAARVDKTANGSGFTAGYNAATATLRCVTHEYSEASEPRDAASFVNGDKIIIVEMDPASSSAPLLWSRVVTGTPVNDDITLSAALSSPTFDALKQYRVTYDHYAIQTTTQQLLCSQADDADTQIENLAPPFQYSAGVSPLTFTAYNPSLPIELVPDLSYGDGKALDVGHETALVQLANNLLDYRTAGHNSVLTNFETVSDGTVLTGASTYYLIMFFPVFLTGESSQRTMSVAPFFRAGVTPGSVRVSLCSSPPAADGSGDPATSANPLLCDVPLPDGASSAVFSTSSVTLTTPAAQVLIERGRSPEGVAWIWIEGTVSMACWGLAECDEGTR